MGNNRVFPSKEDIKIIENLIKYYIIGEGGFKVCLASLRNRAFEFFCSRNF
jgi:hypothetical protein